MNRFHAFSLFALTLLATAGCSNPVGDEGRHRNFSAVVITSVDGQTVIAESQGRTGWAQPLVMEPGQVIPVRVFFLDADGVRFQLPHTGAEHTLHVASDDATVARYEPVAEEVGQLVAGAAGTTTLTVHLWHGVHPQGHPDSSLPGLQVNVGG